MLIACQRPPAITQTQPQITGLRSAFKLSDKPVRYWPDNQVQIAKAAGAGLDVEWLSMSSKQPMTSSATSTKRSAGRLEKERQNDAALSGNPGRRRPCAGLCLPDPSGAAGGSSARFPDAEANPQHRDHQTPRLL